MYLFLAKAIAAEGHPDFPAKETHAALIFTVADDFDQALAKTHESMTGLRWESVQIEEHAEVNDTSVSQAEEAILRAYQAAKAKGFAVVIYTDPIE